MTPEELDRIVLADLTDRGVGWQTWPEPLTVRKIAQPIPISAEMAMEYGLIPDTRPPVVWTRRQRFRWWRQDKTRALRIRLGEWIAGQSFSDGDD